MARRWDNALDSSTLTAFANTSTILHRQKVSPIIGWEATVSILEQWNILLEVILGTVGRNSSIYKLSMLIEA